VNTVLLVWFVALVVLVVLVWAVVVTRLLVEQARLNRLPTGRPCVFPLTYGLATRTTRR